MATFEKHGQFQVYWQDNALFVLPFGAFNEEGALAFNHAIHKATESRKLIGWYRFDVFQSKDTMGTPEAESHLTSSFVHSRLHGCKMVMIVGANICARASLTKACAQAGIASQCFDSLPEARQLCEASQLTR